MNVKTLEVGFSNIVNIGRCATIIECDKSGAYITIDEIVEKCQSSHKVIIRGDEPLLQKEELAKICKKLVKLNPRINIEIFTKALIKPIEISGYISNTTFNVLMYPKGDKRYKVDIVMLAWFAEIGANFVFEVNSIEDIDNVIVIMNSVGIKKSQSFITPLKTIKTLYRHVKFYGINLAPSIEWGDDDDFE